MPEMTSLEKATLVIHLTKMLENNDGEIAILRAAGIPDNFITQAERHIEEYRDSLVSELGGPTSETSEI